MIMSKKILYFLCTGNSCRSEMAEGSGKKHLSNEYGGESAGIEAHGRYPQGVNAMKEVDVGSSTQTSDLIDRDVLTNAALVMSLCGDAQDTCPTTPPHVTRRHWGFDAPAKAEG